MPHTTYDTPLLVPVNNLCDIGVVNPVGWREWQVYEIKEVDGRPFARVLIHPFGFVDVPVDIGGASGDDLLAVDLMEALQQSLGLGRQLARFLCLSESDIKTISISAALMLMPDSRQTSTTVEAISARLSGGSGLVKFSNVSSLTICMTITDAVSLNPMVFTILFIEGNPLSIDCRTVTILASRTAIDKAAGARVFSEITNCGLFEIVAGAFCSFIAVVLFQVAIYLLKILRKPFRSETVVEVPCVFKLFNSL